MKPFRLIVAGSRDFPRVYSLPHFEKGGVSAVSLIIFAVGRAGFQPTEVVSGAARGMDTYGEDYAALMDIPASRFPADWSQGKGAGFVRNAAMADYAAELGPGTGGLLAFPSGPWDAKKGGTQHMIRTAKAKGLPCYVLTDPYKDLRYGTGHVWLNRPELSLFTASEPSGGVNKEAAPPTARPKKGGFQMRRMKDVLPRPQE